MGMTITKEEMRDLKALSAMKIKNQNNSEFQCIVCNKRVSMPYNINAVETDCPHCKNRGTLFR